MKQRNAINVIKPYRWEGMWVFDDPDAGLNKEPFVSGADSIIDLLVQDIDNAADGFRLIFSEKPFPGYSNQFNWRRAEYDGNWYYSEEFQMEGWLCPALLCYFDAAPENLFVKAEAIGNQK